jgi:hypothetical protein
MKRLLLTFAISLSAAVAGWARTVTVTHHESACQTIIRDKTNYSSGVYTGYLAPFSGTEVTPNEMVIMTPRIFPNAVEINWNYSSTPCVGVCAFLAISYGNSAGTVARTPITPIQVNNLNSLMESHDLAFGGTTSGYDVIDDAFLYSSPTQTARLFEFEVFLHTPSQSAAWVASAKQLGTATISGISWTVAWYPNSGGVPDVLFTPADGADVPNATIDLRAMFLWARSKGIITGTEWFTGFALGAEPQSNSGSMTIKAFSATSD